MRYLANSILHVAIIVGFCLFGPLADLQSAAGQARSPGSVARRIEEFNAQATKAARDELNREMYGKPAPAQQGRLTKIKKAEIREDFDTLQTSYNEIVTRLNSKEPLPTKFVLDVTEAIRKAGARLQGNVDFLAVRDRATPPVVPSMPERSMRELCIAVHGFLTNPLFETGVLDVAEAGKARDTLDKVVQLSATLHNRVGKAN
jgi:hypothetical protein